MDVKKIINYLEGQIKYWRSLQIPLPKILLGHDVCSARVAKEALKDVLEFVKREEGKQEGDYEEET